MDGTNSPGARRFARSAPCLSLLRLPFSKYTSTERFSLLSHSALEEYASRVAPTKPRTATSAETKWLRSLHTKYATDTAAMARDTRINRLQRTRGQIDESIRRAGGWEAVLATEDA